MTNELLARIDLLNKQLEDYKSRCEKAVKYINSKKRTITKHEAEDTRLPMDTFMYGVDNLLNILNGRSDKGMNKIQLAEIKDYYEKNYDYDSLLELVFKECDKVDDLQQELQRKDNIINKIKKALKDHKEIKNKTNTKEYYIEVDEVLDYIKELEERK